MNKLHWTLVGTILALSILSLQLEVNAQTPKPKTPEVKSVAGRVMTVDRIAKTFTIHPYGSAPGTQSDVKITVNANTTYQWSPATKGKLPTFNDVKRGSWARVNFNGNVVETIFVHVPSQNSKKEKP